MLVKLDLNICSIFLNKGSYLKPYLVDFQNYYWFRYFPKKNGIRIICADFIRFKWFKLISLHLTISSRDCSKGMFYRQAKWILKIFIDFRGFWNVSAESFKVPYSCSFHHLWWILRNSCRFHYLWWIFIILVKFWKCSLISVVFFGMSRFHHLW